MRSTFNRVLWGARFTGHDGRSFLCGEAWHKPRAEAYPGEPTRPLSFRSRDQARAWCAVQMAEWKTRTDSLRKWHVRAVRVREIYREI